MGRIISWSSVFVISMLFIFTPYLRGLFFDSDMYVTEVIIAALFLVNVLWLLFKNPEKTRTLYLLVFLLPMMHLISLTVAESPQGVLDNTFRWLTFACMFVLLIWARQSKEANNVSEVLPYVFQLTGICIAFFSLFGLWGWVKFQDIMLAERMTGPFQYANTFAAVIAAFWLYALVALTREKLPLWATVFYSLPLVAYGVGFFHSYSRGAMVVFPVAWLIGLLLLKGRAQVSYIIHTLVSVVSSLLVFQFMTKSEDGAANPGLIPFIIATVVVMLLVQLIRVGIERFASNNAFFTKFTARSYAPFIMPALIIVLGVLVMLDMQNQGLVYQTLPESMQKRVSDISLETSSALGRTNVYEDAFKISKDAPMLGLGGEGWRIVYPKYQEIPYLNNEVHNGYLELLLSVGWLGLLVFVLVFGYLLLQLLRRAKQEQETGQQLMTIASLVALAMLFIHAAIDFDFSYGTVWLVVCWLLAMGVPVQPWRTAIPGNTQIPIMATRTIAAITAVLVLIGGLYEFRFYMAEQPLLAKPKMKLAEAQSLFERAVAYNPYNVEYHLKLADVYAKKYRQEKAEQWKAKAIASLKLAEMREPNNAFVKFTIGTTYLTLNDLEQAFQYFNKSLEYDRFRTEVYDAFMQIKTRMAVQAVEEGNKDRATEMAKQVIEHYEQYRKVFDPYKAQEIPDKRQLELEQGTYLFIGQSQMILGEYAKAIEQLKVINHPKLSVDAQAMMVVAYERLGQNEQAAAITKTMIAQQSDFPQRVIQYRFLVKE